MGWGGRGTSRGEAGGERKVTRDGARVRGETSGTGTTEGGRVMPAEEMKTGPQRERSGREWMLGHGAGERDREN